MTNFEHWMLYFCFCSFVVWNALGAWISIRLLCHIRTLQDEIRLINEDLYFARRQAAQNAKTLEEASSLLSQIRWKMEKKEHQ